MSMNHYTRKVFLGLILITVSLRSIAEVTHTTQVLGEGKAFETTYHIIDSHKPGPTVMVTAGVHGDELAGPIAAAQMTHWKISRGKLIILPRANVPALAVKSRRIPNKSGEENDLNRNFPSKDNPGNPGNPGAPGNLVNPEEVRGKIAEVLWEFVVSQKPDWLLDLHEGFDYKKSNPKSVGNSIIHHRTKRSNEAVRQMLIGVNRTEPDINRIFVPLGPPVNRSLARAASVRLGIESMILETTGKLNVSRRVRQHRIMVYRLLLHLKMAAHDHTIITGSKSGKTQIGIYDGTGVGRSGPVTLTSILEQHEHIEITRLAAGDVQDNVLRQFDLVIFPGGSGSKQANAIDVVGRKNVRLFIENGGGYMGICAGGYLATSEYTWGLKIVTANTIDRKHWNRGRGNVDIELTKAGKEFFKGVSPEILKKELLSVRYANGPIFGPFPQEQLKGFTSLAHYRSELTENNALEGAMINTPAIITGKFGKGRVVCFSPHPESTKGLEEFITHAARWATQQTEE